MNNILCNQFIYGKLSRGEREYQIVAHTPDLDINELKEICAIYRFWGTYPPEGTRKAVGISPYKKYLLLFKKSPAIGNLERPFDQTHFVFIDCDVFSVYNFPIFKLLPWFFQKDIPRFENYHPHLSQVEIPCLRQENSHKEEQEDIRLIEKCLRETDFQNAPFLLSIIGAIANSKRVLINNIPDRLKAESYYVTSLNLLLPSVYRSKISFAVGNIDVRECRWADLLVKTVNSERILLNKIPEDCIWINRQSQEFIGSYDRDWLTIPYISKLNKFFQEKSEKTYQLIEQLNRDNSNCIDFQNFVDNEVEIINNIPVLSDLEDQIIQFIRQSESLNKLESSIQNIFNLNLEDRTTIFNKLETLKTNKYKIYLIDLILSNWELAKCKLPQLFELTCNINNLKLNTIIDYVNNCPEDWRSFQQFSFSLYSDSLEEILFLDNLLNINEEFLGNVLIIWNNLISKNHNNKKILIEQSHSWERLIKQPDDYIYKVLSENLQIDIGCYYELIVLLLENKAKHFLTINFLTYLCQQWEKCSEKHLCPNRYEDLLLIILSSGIFNNFNEDKKNILTPVLLNPEFSDLATLSNTIKKELSLDDVKDLAKIINSRVKSIRNVDETKELLTRCEILHINKDNLLNPLLSLDKSEIYKISDTKLILEIFFKKPDKINKQYLKEKESLLKLLFNARYHENSSQTKKSDNIFIDFLKNIVLSKEYDILQTWKNNFYSDYEQDDLYKRDFKQASLSLINLCPIKTIFDFIDHLKSNKLQVESEIIEEKLAELQPSDRNHLIALNSKIDNLEKKVDNLQEKISVLPKEISLILSKNIQEIIKLEYQQSKLPKEAKSQIIDDTKVNSSSEQKNTTLSTSKATDVQDVSNQTLNTNDLYESNTANNDTKNQSTNFNDRNIEDDDYKKKI
jgi:hypothetical protein